MRSRRELNTYLSLVGGGTSIHFSIRWECLFALKRPGFFRQVMEHTCAKGYFLQNHPKNIISTFERSEHIFQLRPIREGFATL